MVELGEKMKGLTPTNSFMKKAAELIEDASQHRGGGGSGGGEDGNGGGGGGGSSSALDGDDASDGGSEEVEEHFAAYDTIPLSLYEQDSNFWYINKDFPGLRAIHKDPWIFIIDGMFSDSECDALVAKTANHMERAVDHKGALVV